MVIAVVVVIVNTIASCFCQFVINVRVIVVGIVIAIVSIVIVIVTMAITTLLLMA